MVKLVQFLDGSYGVMYRYGWLWHKKAFLSSEHDAIWFIHNRDIHKSCRFSSQEEAIKKYIKTAVKKFEVIKSL